ncbi:TonB-dependent siderophore receptor [Parasphingopyxis sp.]|uniref:TonB-dependent receptor n=1 Tax=Parasphingopyxis sp. TaxID=1920299 RepID=UPI00262C9489|nr:TonB-dependent siderophore receptor [Parasphingopyxis sp.]
MLRNVSRVGLPLMASISSIAFVHGTASAQGVTTPATTTMTSTGPQIVVTGQYFEEDTISATKTETPLINVPQSLSIISREQIDDQVLGDIGDILRYTPGASIGQGEGHRDQITIRGQNTTADFYIDGLRDDVQYFRPLYNLERIEILRGSNAMIFGRGGGGGIINRVTKTAIAGDTFGNGTASVDTFGSVYIAGDANIAAGDRLGFRLNAFYESLNNHRDFFDGDRFAINPTATLEFGPNTRLIGSYEYVDDDRVVDRGVPALNGEPLEGFDNTFFGDPDANFTTLEAHISRLRFEHDFSDSLSYNSTLQYADYNKFYQNIYPVGFDDVANTVSLDGYRDTTQRENFIIQGNLIWRGNTGAIGHTLLFGYEYGDQQTQNARRDVLFAGSMDDQITFGFTDPLAIPAFTFPRFTRARNSDAEFFSVYAQDQIAIGDHVIIVAGIRFDHFEIDVVDQIEVNDGAADGNDGFLSRSDSEWSPRIGIIYKPQDNVSLYASYARSFLPRSGDQFLTLSPTTESLAPEQFDNYEIGIKWDPQPGLSLTAAIFRLDRENGTTPDPNDPGNSILTGSRTEGFELQLVGEILPGWSVNAGYSYLDADERGRVVGTTLANRTLAQVPEHMLSMWNHIDVTEQFGIGVGVTHQSSQFAAIDNSVRLPSFTRFDAALFYDISENVRVQLNVENLFDEDYFPAAHNNNNISTGEPLNARFTVRANF